MSVVTIHSVAQFKLTSGGRGGGFQAKIDRLYNYIYEVCGKRLHAPPQPDQHGMHIALTEAQYAEIKELIYGDVQEKYRDLRFLQMLDEVGLRPVHLTSTTVKTLLYDIDGWNHNAYRLTSEGRQPGGKPIIIYTPPLEEDPPPPSPPPPTSSAPSTFKSTKRSRAKKCPAETMDACTSSFSASSTLKTTSPIAKRPRTVKTEPTPPSMPSSRTSTNNMIDIPNTLLTAVKVKLEDEFQETNIAVSYDKACIRVQSAHRAHTARRELERLKKIQDSIVASFFISTSHT